MSQYEPELGQALYGQPIKEFAVSELVEACLQSISYELDRVMGNLGNRDWSSPFENSGNVPGFVCPTFSTHAYSWGDDEQPYNFKWGGVEISWYKWSGRGLSSNVEITPDMASKMLDECLAAVREYEQQNERR